MTARDEMTVVGQLDATPGSEDGRDDVVELAIPADARRLRLARLTAAGIGSDLGFTVEAVEDLRVAVDELCAVLIEDAPAGARLTLRYRARGHEIVVEGQLDVALEAPPELHVVARELLDIVADRYEIGEHDGRRTFRLVKRGRDLVADG